MTQEVSLPLRAQATARRVLLQEAEAIGELAGSLDADSLGEIASWICSAGFVLISGVGKSGIIGRKIAATLSSTGTPAAFLHPAEALHGDLGIAAAADVAILLSASGETDELRRMAPALRELGLRTAIITANSKSTLAQQADVVLLLPAVREACPLGLAPTTSTILMMALGDAIAASVMERRGFGREDFARFHPGGSLGKRLLLRVEAVMRSGKECPQAGPRTFVRKVLPLMGKNGAVCVVDKKEHLVGFFSDGDLRRVLEEGKDPLNQPVGRFMTARPHVVGPQDRAYRALEIIKEKGCDSVPVVEAWGRLVGLVDERDLLMEGLS